jgi:hypothetical protein
MALVCVQCFKQFIVNEYISAERVCLPPGVYALSCTELGACVASDNTGRDGDGNFMLSDDMCLGILPGQGTVPSTRLDGQIVLTAFTSGFPLLAEYYASVLVWTLEFVRGILRVGVFGAKVDETLMPAVHTGLLLRQAKTPPEIVLDAAYVGDYAYDLVCSCNKTLEARRELECETLLSKYLS